MDRVLSVHLAAAAALAEAQVAALFVPTGAGALELKAQREIDQAGWDVTHVAWNMHQRELREGQVARIGSAIVWPLRAEGKLVAVVYLDHAHSGFPEEHERLHGRVLAERVRNLGRPQPLGPYVATHVASPEAEQRRQLEVVLRQVAGNVAAAARVLGVNRDTIYERAARLALNVDDFRPARHRARKTLGEA